MTALRRAAHALLLAVTMCASSALVGPHPAGVEAAPTMRTATTAAHDSESLINRVESVVQLLGVVAAQPGVRPPFIPYGALVVRGGEIHLAGLGEALTGRAGQIVGWVR